MEKAIRRRRIPRRDYKKIAHKIVPRLGGNKKGKLVLLAEIRPLFLVIKKSSSPVSNFYKSVTTQPKKHVNFESMRGAGTHPPLLGSLTSTKFASEDLMTQATTQGLRDGNTNISLGEVSDLDLVAMLQAGDQNGFGEVLNRYTEKVSNLALRIARNHEDAEEIVQDVFITVYRKIANFEGKSAFSSWLYRITVNTAFMKLRKRKQTPTTPLEDMGQGIKDSWVGERSDTSDVNYLTSRHELRQHLDAAIAKLPEEYRMIFVLRDVDGLSNQEVGEILGVSVPAVKSRLHRSRQMLRKRLSRYFDDYQSEETISFGPAMTQQRCAA